MHRSAFARVWQIALWLLLLGAFATASIGGVEAQVFIPQPSSASTNADAALAKKPTATPTRKPKKTKTPTPTSTATPEPAETVEPSATPTAEESATPEPSATRKGKKTRTPTPTAPTIQPTPFAPCKSGSIPKPAAKLDGTQETTLTAPDCSISITFAPDTFDRPLTARFRWTDKNPGLQQVVGRFEVRFYNAAGKRVKKLQPKQSMTLRVHYDPRALGALPEPILDLVYWDKKAKSWIPLYSKLDVEKNVLEVSTTQVAAVTGVTALEDLNPYLPTHQEFQTDLFSGAATANYPLTLPPGQGGLTPKLNLAYSSAVADNFDSNTQASFVGVGWSLDTSYIIRHERNYNDNNTDKQLNFFTLVLDGTSYELVPENGTTYHTASERYWTITNNNTNPTNPDPTAWTIVSKDGTTYTFGSSANHRATWYRRNPLNYGVSATPENYMWVLKNVTDAHGNTINYSYIKETATCPANGGTYVTALYPDTIKYNYNGTTPLTEIDFAYMARTDQAIHYPTTQCGVAPHLKLALEHVYVKTATSTNNMSAPPTVRQYNFSYNNGGSAAVVFPGIPYTATNSTNAPRGALGLTHVWLQDPDDANVQLNMGVFDYGVSTSNTQANRLINVSNGIGGEITYGYTTAKYSGGSFTLPAADNWSTIYTTNFVCTGTACDWSGTNASVGITNNCSGGTQSDKALLVQPNSGGGYAKYRMYPFAPGGQYTVNVKVEGAGQGATVSVGIARDIDNPGTEFVSSGNVGVSDCQNKDITVGDTTNDIGFALPPTSSMFQINVHTSANIRIKQVTVRKVDVYPHVVVSKQLDDGRGNVNTYQYTYENLAVNDENTSAVISSAGCYPPGAPATCVYLRHPYGTEFRGFDKVTVTTPDPKFDQTIYRFKQDDIFKGQPYCQISPKLHIASSAKLYHLKLPLYE